MMSVSRRMTSLKVPLTHIRISPKTSLRTLHSLSITSNNTFKLSPTHIARSFTSTSSTFIMQESRKPIFAPGADESQLEAELTPLLIGREEGNGQRWVLSREGNGIEREFRFKTFTKTWVCFSFLFFSFHISLSSPSIHSLVFIFQSMVYHFISLFGKYLAVVLPSLSPVSLSFLKFLT
jgi:hypothetical protein